MGERLRILQIWTDLRSMPETAIPVGVGQLRIALGRFADQIQYEDQPACSREDLLLRVNTFRPHILHISGHGDASGAVALMHPVSGLASTLMPAELAKLLAGRTELRLLVLDCCHGFAALELLRGVVPALIATRGAIREPYPIAFASALYHSIASGRSLPIAFDDAVVASAERAEGSSGFDLWTSDVDPHTLFLRESISAPHGLSGSALRWLCAAGLLVGACLGIAAPLWMLPRAVVGELGSVTQIKRVQADAPYVVEDRAIPGRE